MDEFLPGKAHAPSSIYGILNRKNRRRPSMTGVRKQLITPYGLDHAEDLFMSSSNLLAANGLSKPFADGYT